MGNDIFADIVNAEGTGNIYQNGAELLYGITTYSTAGSINPAQYDILTQAGIASSPTNTSTSSATSDPSGSYTIDLANSNAGNLINDDSKFSAYNYEDPPNIPNAGLTSGIQNQQNQQNQQKSDNDKSFWNQQGLFPTLAGAGLQGLGTAIGSVLSSETKAASDMAVLEKQAELSAESKKKTPTSTGTQSRRTITKSAGDANAAQTAASTVSNTASTISNDASKAQTSELQTVAPNSANHSYRTNVTA